jgi:hypothetical protein
MQPSSPHSIGKGIGLAYWMGRRNLTSTARNPQPSWEAWFKGSPIMVTHVAKSSSTLIPLPLLVKGTSALSLCQLSSSWIVLSVLVLRLPNEMETSELRIWPFPILSASQGSAKYQPLFLSYTPKVGFLPFRASWKLCIVNCSVHWTLSCLKPFFLFSNLVWQLSVPSSVSGHCSYASFKRSPYIEEFNTFSIFI